jgi:hypothetical protein
MLCIPFSKPNADAMQRLDKRNQKECDGIRDPQVLPADPLSGLSAASIERRNTPISVERAVAERPGGTCEAKTRYFQASAKIAVKLSGPILKRVHTAYLNSHNVPAACAIRMGRRMAAVILTLTAMPTPSASRLGCADTCENRPLVTLTMTESPIQR